MSRWVRLLLGVSGVVLLVCAGLVWWSAERALGPAPETTTSSRGGLVTCGYRPGLTSCDPPVLPAATVAAIAVLAIAGAVLVAVVLFGALRRRREHRARG